MTLTRRSDETTRLDARARRDEPHASRLGSEPTVTDEVLRATVIGRHEDVCVRTPIAESIECLQDLSEDRVGLADRREISRRVVLVPELVGIAEPEEEEVGTR